jgi:hypothetical protein
MLKQILTVAVGLFITQYALADGPGLSDPYVATAQVVAPQGHAAPVLLALHESTLILTPMDAGANNQMALAPAIGDADVVNA